MSLFTEDPSKFLTSENGVLRESLSHARVMLFGCSAYRSMCDALYEQFQSVAGVILYRMGEGYGIKVASTVPVSEMSRENAIKIFQRIGLLADWGNIKIRIVDEKSAECIVHKSPFVLYREDSGKVSCYFLSGILSATASVLFGKKFTTREVSCITAGATSCKFVITEKI
jgi:predicted hydrocarbon binding protein